jgi:hypothetical protein
MPSHGRARLRLASIQAQTPALDEQNRAPATGDFDPGANGQIGAFGLPEPIADPHFAATVLDRLFHEQGAADILLTAGIEIRQVAHGYIGAHVAAHPEHGGDGEHSKGDDLPGPSHARDECQGADDDGGDAEPEKMHAGQDCLQGEQHRAQDEPIPGTEAGEQREQGGHGVSPGGARLPRRC